MWLVSVQTRTLNCSMNWTARLQVQVGPRLIHMWAQRSGREMESWWRLHSLCCCAWKLDSKNTCVTDWSGSIAQYSWYRSVKKCLDRPRYQVFEIGSGPLVIIIPCCDFIALRLKGQPQEMSKQSSDESPLIDLNNYNRCTDICSSVLVYIFSLLVVCSHADSSDFHCTGF